MTGTFATVVAAPRCRSRSWRGSNGRPGGARQRRPHREAQDPSFIATLGMLNVAKGLALVISGLKPIYFNDTPEFNRAAMGSVVGSSHSASTSRTSRSFSLFAAIIASLVLSKTILGQYTFALGAT